VTKNKRYEAHYDHLNDQRIAQAADRPSPVTLPPPAWGPNKVQWQKDPVPVWAWLQWSTGPAEKVPCVAIGWNDRVVVVAWEPSALSRTAIVWRQAVTHRVTS
jgi:hypothetical protein